MVETRTTCALVNGVGRPDSATMEALGTDRTNRAHDGRGVPAVPAACAILVSRCEARARARRERRVAVARSGGAVHAEMAGPGEYRTDRAPGCRAGLSAGERCVGPCAETPTLARG